MTTATPDPVRVTTRDLLAEIETREHTSPRPAELERHERSYVRWMLLSVIVVLGALYGALWWLDPISVTGRQTRFSIVENGGVRQAKLDLMEQLPATPDVLVLGSSRSMKLNPATIEDVTGGETAFNGAVSGGTTKDIYLYARYAEDLWGDQGEFPHLVVGVVNDVLRFGGTSALDPRLKRYLPKEDAAQANQLEVAKALLQTKTVEAGARAVKRVVEQEGPGALLNPVQKGTEINADLAVVGKQKGNNVEFLDDRGMQEFKPGADYSKSVEVRVERQMTVFARNGYEKDPDYTGADDRAVDLLRKTIELANRNGDVPTFWVTPFHPTALRFLPDEYDVRNARFREVFADLRKDTSLEFNFIDLDDISSFGGDPEEFHDGIHPTEKNTAKIIAKLHEEGALTRAANRR
ncbi:MAG: hypothetical protein JWM90_1668 [Thermoleophilia bacterium]|nr:hypothetical protein [Thermoleophilia bacterium]